jgi:hypothetical protein
MGIDWTKIDYLVMTWLSFYLDLDNELRVMTRTCDHLYNSIIIYNHTLIIKLVIILLII